MADTNQIAEDRGHTRQAIFSAGCHDLHLAYEPGAELDQLFVATCLDTGDKLEVNGWLYTVETDAEDDDGQPSEAAEWADFDPDC